MHTILLVLLVIIIINNKKEENNIIDDEMNNKIYKYLICKILLNKSIIILNKQNNVYKKIFY